MIPPDRILYLSTICFKKKLCNLLVRSMDNKFILAARLESGKTCKAKYKILSINVQHIQKKFSKLNNPDSIG